MTEPWRAIRGLGRAGVSTVEFALVAMVFMTMLLVTMEVCYDLAIGAALDHGARAASRFGTTGALALPGSPINNRLAALQAEVINNSGMLLSAANLQMSETSYSGFGNALGGSGGVDGPGQAGQVVLYKLTYTQPYLTPIAVAVMGHIAGIYTSTVAVLNEPY